MPYVRREAGQIVSIYRVSPTDITEEFLPVDDAEVVAFLNPPPVPVESTELTPEDIERLLIGVGVTRGEINAAKNARGTPRP